MAPCGGRAPDELTMAFGECLGPSRLQRLDSGSFGLSVFGLQSEVFCRLARPMRLLSAGIGMVQLARLAEPASRSLGLCTYGSS